MVPLFHLIVLAPPTTCFPAVLKAPARKKGTGETQNYSWIRIIVWKAQVACSQFGTRAADCCTYRSPHGTSACIKSVVSRNRVLWKLLSSFVQLPRPARRRLGIIRCQECNIGCSEAARFLHVNKVSVSPAQVCVSCLLLLAICQWLSLGMCE